MPCATDSPNRQADPLAAVAATLGLRNTARDAETFSTRIAGGRFFVACLGQFKRGKSTLLNALLHDDVLPTGVVPVTSVVTVIRHGSERRARIRRDGGPWQDVPVSDLASYVAEDGNPGNVKQIEAVEVFHPHPLLEGGMSFVDARAITGRTSRRTWRSSST
jgi:hypothetical protein